MTSWAPVVIRFTVAVLPGGEKVLILDSKTLWEQLNIDTTEGLREKALGHGELAESKHGLAARGRRFASVVVFLEAMPTIADAKRGPNLVDRGTVRARTGYYD